MNKKLQQLITDAMKLSVDEIKQQIIPYYKDESFTDSDELIALEYALEMKTSTDEFIRISNELQKDM